MLLSSATGVAGITDVFGAVGQQPIPTSRRNQFNAGFQQTFGRFLQVDPEIALKNANIKFTRRFREMERLAAENGQAFAEVPREEKEKLWEVAKRVGAERSERKPAKGEAARQR